MLAQQDCGTQPQLNHQATLKVDVCRTCIDICISYELTLGCEHGEESCLLHLAVLLSYIRPDLQDRQCSCLPFGSQIIKLSIADET